MSTEKSGESGEQSAGERADAPGMEGGEHPAGEEGVGTQTAEGDLPDCGPDEDGPPAETSKTSDAVVIEYWQVDIFADELAEYAENLDEDLTYQKLRDASVTSSSVVSETPPPSSNEQIINHFLSVDEFYRKLSDSEQAEDVLSLCHTLRSVVCEKEEVGYSRWPQLAEAVGGAATKY